MVYLNWFIVSLEVPNVKCIANFVVLRLTSVNTRKDSIKHGWRCLREIGRIKANFSFGG